MSATNRFRRFAGVSATAVVAGLATALIVAQPMAQTAEPGGGIVVTVDGVPITEADLSIANDEFADQLSRVPIDQRRDTLIDLLVHIRLAAKAAQANGIAAEPDIAARMNLVRDRVLYSEFLNRIFDKEVTEEAARKLFADEQANAKAAYEYHVRHILVPTEKEAKEVLDALAKGDDFAKLAADKSVDPGSASQGGDIGFIAAGDTVEPFEKAAFALEVGQYTKAPVESQFGFHIIRLDEKREAPAKTFEEEAPRLQQDLVRNAFDKAIGDLVAAAKIIKAPPPGPTTDPAPAPAAPN
jgi:peptidyl-prolyl cis-trans isomerase C